MQLPDLSPPGSFCWVDLAATDADAAMAFYSRAFGWSFRTSHANGGRFTRCQVGSRDVASLYPLSRAQRDHGVPSHWTPYLRVDFIDALAQRIEGLGGRVPVAPFDVEDTARIALVQDPVGALLGLWQPLTARSALGTMIR